MSSSGVHYLAEDLSGVLSCVRIPDIDELPPEERPKDKYYTHEQVDELLYGDHGRNQVRDRAIMALILYFGLRVSELCSLTVGQFRNATDCKIRLKRKGGAYLGLRSWKQCRERPTTKDDLPAVFIKYYPAYAAGSMTVTELARICGLSRPTVYKYIRFMA